MSARTAKVPIDITCPTWCVETAEHHAENLWNLAGCCDHRATKVAIDDPTGYSEPLQEPRLLPPVDLWLSLLTTPDGRPQATPILFIDDVEHSLEQAEAVANAILELVSACRDSLATRPEPDPSR